MKFKFNPKRNHFFFNIAFVSKEYLFLFLFYIIVLKTLIETAFLMSLLKFYVKYLCNLIKINITCQV